MKNPTDHPGYTPIDLAAIQQAIADGRPVSWLRYNHGISERTCQKIAEGENITYYLKRKWLGKVQVELCTHCGAEKKMPGNRYLGPICWRRNSDGERRAEV